MNINKTSNPEATEKRLLCLTDKEKLPIFIKILSHFIQSFQEEEALQRPPLLHYCLPLSVSEGEKKNQVKQCIC